MLKNLKKKFAKVALVVLALQLVFLGLGVGPIAATAAAGEYSLTAVGNVGNFSAPEKSVLDSLGNTILTNGVTSISDPTYFSARSFASVDVTLSQLVTPATYNGNVWIKPISSDVKDLQLWAYSPVDNLWFDVNKSGFGDPDGTPVAAYVGQTVPVYAVSNIAGTYQLNINLVDAADKTLNIASATDTITIKSPYSFTAAPATALGNKGSAETSYLDGTTKNTYLGGPITPITDATYFTTVKNYKKFDVTLSQDISSPNYFGKVRLDATLIPGVQIWTFVSNVDPTLNRWVDVNQSGFGDLAGVDVSQFSGKTISYYLVSGTEGTFPVNFNLSDITDKTSIVSMNENVLVDATAPVVTMTSKPVIVSDTKKAIEVTFSANEPIVLSSSNVTFTQGTKVYPGTPATQTDPTRLVVYIPADSFDVGVTPIDVVATFSDISGNLTPFVGQIQVDTIAPAAVTGVTTLVNADGTVTLSWVNPPAGTFSTLRIVRVGDFTVTLDPSATSYTDATTVKGQTYQYVIVVGDEAGNETTTAPVSVTVPAPVVASAISDTTTPAPTNTNTTPAVKASTTDTSKTDNKPGFPAWGIILLVILALVGGYLIWNQKPATPPVVETKKPNTNSSKKK